MKQRPQTRTATAEQHGRPSGGANGGLEFGLPDSPFLTLEEGARFARFDHCVDPVAAFYKWLGRQAIPVARRGRAVLIERRILEQQLRRR